MRAACLTLILATVLCLASAGERLHGQQPPDPGEALLSCIANGTLVRHTYIQHTDPEKLKQAVQLFETQASGAAYPDGTVIRMIPQEAMVKRATWQFPDSNGWEYFALAVTPQGTTVRSSGPYAENRLGACHSCHAKAASFDFVCERGHGCATVPLTDEQIASLQKADPRCPK